MRKALNYVYVIGLNLEISATFPLALCIIHLWEADMTYAIGPNLENSVVSSSLKGLNINNKQIIVV